MGVGGSYGRGAMVCRSGKDFTGATCPQICDRTDVVFVNWHNDGDSDQRFSLSRTLALKPKGR